MRHSNIFIRPNGSQTRVVAELSSGPNGEAYFFNYAFYRRSEKASWQACHGSRDPRWKSMPRPDYVKFGRSEMLQVATPGEILKTNAELLVLAQQA